MGRRSHFSFSKRQRELKKKRKAEEKIQKKRLRKAGLSVEIVGPWRPTPTARLDPDAPVLEVTDAAIRHLADVLVDVRPPDALETLMRIETEHAGQLPAVPGPARDGDVMFDHNGIPVLAVDPALAAQLTGRTLDVAGFEDETRLVLR